jgi:hypothetical protein
MRQNIDFFTFHLGLISKTIEQSNVPHIYLNMQMAAGLPLSLFEFLCLHKTNLSISSRKVYLFNLFREGLSKIINQILKQFKTDNSDPSIFQNIAFS